MEWVDWGFNPAEQGKGFHGTVRSHSGRGIADISNSSGVRIGSAGDKEHRAVSAGTS